MRSILVGMFMILSILIFLKGIFHKEVINLLIQFLQIYLIFIIVFLFIFIKHSFNKNQKMLLPKHCIILFHARSETEQGGKNLYSTLFSLNKSQGMGDHSFFPTGRKIIIFLLGYFSQSLLY